MTEPSTVASAMVTLGGVAATAAMPGVNSEALIGAFAGAAVFAMHSKDLPVLKRLVYMAISILVGYFAEDEIRRVSGIQDTTLAAFLASAFVVTAALSGIDWLRKFDFASIWRK